MQNIDGCRPEDIYKLVSVKSGDEDLTEIVRESKRTVNKVLSSDPKYNIEFVFDYRMKLEGCGKIDIEIDSETLVPIYDINYTHKISRPLNNYHDVFNFDNLKPLRKLW